MTEREKAIFEAQGYLRNIARSDGDIIMVYPDGIYGEETYASVRSFQKKQGLTESGEIDYETWVRLVNENERVVFENSEPVRIAYIKKEDLPLKQGDRNELVYTLKLMIRKLARHYSNFKTLELTDEFDEETKQQIELFQDVITHEITGEVDKRTWNELADLYILLP